MSNALPANPRTSSVEDTRTSAQSAVMSSRAVSPDHWAFFPIPMPDGGYLGHGYDFAGFFQDIFELGRRVADHLDDEMNWGASGVILLMAAPGGAWEGQ